MLQTLADIPNSRARQQELQYRLQHLEREAIIQLLCLALDDPYPPLRHDVAEGFQVLLGRGEGPAQPLDDEITGYLEAIAINQRPEHEITRKLNVPRELLPEDSLRARITACVALEASPNPKQTVEVIRPLLHEESADLRYQALIAMNRLVPNTQLLHDVVVDALDDGDPEIVVVATQIAVMHGWADLVSRFLHARARLRGEDRTQITFSVGELIDNSELTPSDLPAEARGDMIAECVDALRHEPHTAAAIKTLANLEAREAIGELVQVTKRWFAHPILKVEAAAALVDLDNPAGEKYLEKALHSRRKDSRGYALRVVGERKLSRYFSHLVDVATSNDYHADTAALALADYGGDEARAILNELGDSHPNTEVRRLATRALTKGLALDPRSFDATLDR